MPLLIRRKPRPAAHPSVEYALQRRELMPHQLAALQWIFSEGPFSGPLRSRYEHPALLMEMRLGKSLIAIRAVQRWSEEETCPSGGGAFGDGIYRSLVAAPTTVLGSWRRELSFEGERFTTLGRGGPSARQNVLEQTFLPDGGLGLIPGQRLWILANYESIRATPGMEALPWDVVIADECFVEGTKVDTPSGPSAIQDMKPGDLVYNRDGVSRVTAVWSRTVHSVLRVRFADRAVICSENHPFWVINRGWIPAKLLQEGDELHVRNSVPELQPLIPGLEAFREEEKVLLQFMFDEVQTQEPRVQAEVLQRSEPEKEAFRSHTPPDDGNVSGRTICSGQECQPDACPGKPGKDAGNAYTNRASLEAAGRQWQTSPSPSGLASSESWRGVGPGALCGNQEFTVSEGTKDCLRIQNRHSLPCSQAGNRSGWADPQVARESNPGPEKGTSIARAWVESIETVQPRDPAIARSITPEGLYRLWDIEVEGNPSFYAEGVLVHNSTRIKNPQAQITKIFVRGFGEASHRMILSGMPSPESLLELYCQFAFLHGRFAGCRDYWHYRNEYFEPDYTGYGWVPKPGTLNHIKELIHSKAFVMRRQDAGIGSKKIYETRSVGMTPRQKALYEQIEDTYAYTLDAPQDDPNPDLGWAGMALSGEGETNYSVVAATWLARVAGGFDPEGGLISSLKTDELIRLLRGEFPREQVVVFFRFNRELEHVSVRMDELSMPHSYITGHTSQEDRERRIEAFRRGQFPHLLAQIKVARFGIDCSSADTAIYYSNSWSMEDRAQSEDRILNPTKTSPLLIVDLVTEGTVDEDVVYALQNKSFDAHWLLTKVRERRDA